MFLDLPTDIHTLIYKKLDASSRIRMNLVFPKKYDKKNIQKSIYHNKKLAVVTRYIKRNKDVLKKKTKQLPMRIQDFLINSAKDDLYARELCEEIDIHIKDDNIDVDLFPTNIVQRLVQDIRMTKISEKRMDFYKDITDEDFKEKDLHDFQNCIYKICDKETFQLLQQNKIINTKLITPFDHYTNSCNALFTMINHCNASLLDLLMTSDNEYLNKQFAINYIHNSTISSIFYSSPNSLKLILKYFPDIPKERLIETRDKAEEYLCEDSILLLSNYIVDQ